MTLSVNSITSAIPVTSIARTNKLNQVSFKAENNESSDSIVFAPKELSVEDKQKLIKKARTTAAGWAIFGSIGSTIYYAARSDKKVAKKYNLDLQKDKELVKRIKKEQTMWTLPGLCPGLGPIIGYLVSANLSSSNIEID